MLMLKPPALKRQGYKYHEAFEFEWQYRYKEHMSYSDFLNTTGEGKVIQDSMKRDGYTFNLERFYDNLANRIDKEFKAEQRKQANKIIKEVEKEQRKLGNWIVDYQDCYMIYENNELVEQDSWWNGKHTMLKKEGFEESSVKKAIRERMEKEGYEYYILDGWLKI